MELISRDEAITMLEDMVGQRDEDGYIRIYKSDAIANLRSLSSIDLVRCEECIYYKESDYIKGDMACKYHIGHTYYTEADRYCYYGDRNEDVDLYQGERDEDENEDIY